MYFIADYPNGATKTPPAPVPIKIGIAFIALPFIAWWRGKGARMSDGTIMVHFLSGAALVIYGIALWFQW